MRDFIDVFPINQNSHLIKKISAYEMQYGANLLHKTNLHGLQHQSSTSANEKKDDFWLLETEYSCIDRKYFHWKCAFSFSKTKHVRVCVHWIDTAWPCKKNINAENIVYLCFNFFLSRKDNENYGNLYHHFIHGIKKITPSLRNHDIWTENAPIIFFSQICYD